jgi:diamine N-acetyltransferase
MIGMENKMKIRFLEERDSIYMLEWMKDPKVNCFFRFNSENITLDKVIEFIKNSKYDENNYHFAIVDDNDIYQGTISLKNINNEAKTAEYAIALRYSSQRKGIGLLATKYILDYAFNNLCLNKVYLNVLVNNFGAIKLYEKCGFRFEGEFKQHLKINGKLMDLRWYGVVREEYYDNK